MTSAKSLPVAIAQFTVAEEPERNLEIIDGFARDAAAGGAKKEYLGKSISPGLEKLIEERENQQAEAGEKKFVSLVEEDAGQTCSETICPIIAGGDAIGAVIAAGQDAARRQRP